MNFGLCSIWEAMAAPRPLTVAAAMQNFYGIRKREFPACKAASEICRLSGSQGEGIENMTEPDVNVSGNISFHYHTGKHDQMPPGFDLAARFLGEKYTV